MFHIKIKLGESKIDGIGLFSDEDVLKDQRVYTPNPLLDISLSESEFERLNNDEKLTIKHYGYFDEVEKLWRYAFDDIRFCNHSADSNLTLKDGTIIAKKNIQKGEELTQNYNEFENSRFDKK